MTNILTNLDGSVDVTIGYFFEPAGAGALDDLSEDVEQLQTDLTEETVAREEAILAEQEARIAADDVLGVRIDEIEDIPLSTSPSIVVDDSDREYVFVIKDSADKVGFGITLDGELVGKGLGSDGLGALEDALDSEIAARILADAKLQDQIDAGTGGVTTDTGLDSTPIVFRDAAGKHVGGISKYGELHWFIPRPPTSPVLTQLNGVLVIGQSLSVGFKTGPDRKSVV